jgi:protein-disulfide isomerase
MLSVRGGTSVPIRITPCSHYPREEIASTSTQHQHPAPSTQHRVPSSYTLNSMKYSSVTLAVLLLAACSNTEAQQSRQPLASDVVATVGATSITLAQVDERALEQPAANFGNVKLSLALYEARRAAIDELVASALMDHEAKARGIDRAALIEKEISDKVAPVGDTDVAAWYQANQSRVQGAALDQVRAPIRAYLIQERMADARERYLGTLRAKTDVRVMLDPPRQNVTAAKGATKGNPNAPVEIIEFSDFECPFCQRAHATVAQVLSTYGDRIRFVYRHYPLPNHPNAKPAAEAAECANEQGKFWPYHDRLFENTRKLSDADLRQHAAAVGIDPGRFSACLDSHKYRAQVEADARAGEEAGVNGTPAFFINGRMLSGAQPFEAFKRLIDDELQRKSKTQG